MVDSAGRRIAARKAWKTNFNDDVNLDAALPTLLRILEGGGGANATLVAPFDFRCPAA